MASVLGGAMTAGKGTETTFCAPAVVAMTMAATVTRLLYFEIKTLLPKNFFCTKNRARKSARRAPHGGVKLLNGAPSRGG